MFNCCSRDNRTVWKDAGPNHLRLESYRQLAFAKGSFRARRGLMFSLHDLFPTTGARAAAGRYSAPLARCREILAALRDETDAELRERVEALRVVARRARSNRFHAKAVALIAEAVRRTHG